MKSVVKAFILSVAVHSMAMGALWQWNVGVKGLSAQIVEVELTEAHFSTASKPTDVGVRPKTIPKRMMASASTLLPAEAPRAMEILSKGNIHIPAIEYPARCKSKGIEGVAVAKFQLTSSGKPFQVQFEKEVTECPEFSQKIVSALENSYFENMNSLNAESNIYRLPFRFRIQER